MLADERDVESLRREGGRGLELVGGSKLIGGLVGARCWRRPLGVLATYVGTPHTQQTTEHHAGHDHRNATDNPKHK